MTGSALFSLSVIAVGWALVAWHLVQWNKVDQHEPDPAVLKFARRRFVRRMQTSSMIVLLGLGTAIEPWVHTPIMAMTYWAGLLLLVLWIVGLALGDMVLSRQFIQKQRHEEFLDQLRRQHVPGRTEQDRGQSE